MFRTSVCELQSEQFLDSTGIHVFRTGIPVVKVPWDARNGVPTPLIIGKKRSRTAQFVKMHRNGRRNATGTVVYDQLTTSVQNNNDDSCLLQARSVVN